VNASVLVVDDDAGMREMLAARLATRGFRVATCATAAEAIAAVQRDDALEVVVSDVNMKHMDGVELCRRLLEHRPQLPVVLITAFGSMELAIQAIRAGAYDFIPKPFEIDQLVLAIERGVTLARLTDETKRLVDRPGNAVTFLMGNGEAAALAAWRSLRALGAANVYVVEGGVNRWLERYAVPACVAMPIAAPGADALSYRFAHATGEHEPASWPERPASQLFRTPCEDAVSRGGAVGHGEVTWPAYAFTRKVKLQTKAAVKGGCG